MPDRDIRLLCIEDSPSFQATLRLTLSGMVKEFSMASTLAEAMDKLASNGFNCVLLDLTLPDAKGTKSVEMIQQCFPSIPIVVLTGDDTIWRDAILKGAQTTVVKPAPVEDILRAVHHAVVRHSVRKKYEPYQQALASVLKKVDEQLGK